MSRISQQQTQILCIDDEPDLADLTKEFLEREDDCFAAETVTDPREGLQLISDRPPDCVVSDYDMPGMDGIEFLQAVREDYPDLPFILFTGKGSETVASEAIAAGVTDYIQKRPGTEQYELLANKISNAVKQVRARGQLTVRERIVQEMNDISVIIQGGIIKYVSPGVSELLDYAEEYPINRPLSEFISSEYTETVQKHHQAWMTDNGPDVPNQYEVELLSKDGTRVPVEISVCQIEYNGGTATLSTVRDLTERKRQQTRFQEFLEHSTDMITVLDPDGTCLYQSPSVEGILGYDPEELLETNVFTYIHPDDRGSVRKEFTDAVANPERTPIAEYRIQHSNDEWRWIESVGNNQLDNPAVEGFIINSRDITDRREREQQLEQRTEELEQLTADLETQYQYLFEEAPVMAVVTRAEDGGPVVEDCNKRFAETVGYEKSTIIGGKLGSFYSPESKHTLLDEGGYDRALSGEFIREDRELVTSDGKVIETLLRAVPRQQDHGEKAGTLAFYIDISQRKQLERENERLDEFAGTVGHDLRNPLNIAAGHLEMAQETVESDHLSKAANAIDRGNDLVDDLLTLAQAGETAGELESIELDDVATACWDAVRTGSATLETDVTRTLQADPVRLKQLFENLYRNAVEHGEDDITVYVGEMDNGFYIADTGPGIPQDKRKKVFEAGYSTTEDGTGFGLQIVKQVAEAHGWKITATESAQGGARFEATGVGRD